ncbi:MAG: nucleotidyltransferase family protein [Bdellovibrionales bacterium]|jgi:MurNAc alpha-1-phosphate uridylyltransferase
MTTAFPFLSDTGMVLAAGFGKRMQPLTLTTPKPLLKVGGRAMLDHALDHLKAAGITRFVVNAHYLADQIVTHCEGLTASDIVLSREDEILETGGGIKRALAYFSGKPFFVLAGDMPMTEGDAPALVRLAQAWDSKAMDVLLLVMPRGKARGFSGKGDFRVRADGSLARAGVDVPARNVVFISAMIVNPALYDEVSETHFSNNVIFDLAESRGRLFGFVHDGACYHVGTPEDLAEANRLLENGEGWR